MCEMLGLNFSKPTRVSFSLAGLLSRSNWNPDGWGIGCYPDGKASALFKESVAGNQSLLALLWVKHNVFSSCTYLCHIRRASRGQVSYSNSHPFSHHYRALDFLFCHNGTLDRKQLVTRTHFRPAGQTASELAFCFLLSKMSELKIYPVRKGQYIGYTKEEICAIRNILLEINKHGSICCIFSDGHSMFCYRDVQGARDLFFLEQNSQGSSGKFADEDLEMNIHHDGEEIGHGFNVATAPLSNAEWQEVRPGQLIVSQHGRIAANIS
jgi:predicted glutamine amidotransferase